MVFVVKSRRRRTILVGISRNLLKNEKDGRSEGFGWWCGFGGLKKSKKSCFLLCVVLAEADA